MGRRIQTDLLNKVIPNWHDESHLNRYFIDFPPTVTLPSGFIAAEGYGTPVTKIFQKSKDHKKIRI